MSPKPAPHIIRWFLRTFGYGGVTLPPFAIYILAERINEAPLIRHEQCHWQQAQRMGVLHQTIEASRATGVTARSQHERHGPS